MRVSHVGLHRKPVEGTASSHCSRWPHERGSGADRKGSVACLRQIDRLLRHARPQSRPGKCPVGHATARSYSLDSAVGLVGCPSRPVHSGCGDAGLRSWHRASQRHACGRPTSGVSPGDAGFSRRTLRARGTGSRQRRMQRWFDRRRDPGRRGYAANVCAATATCSYAALTAITQKTRSRAAPGDPDVRSRLNRLHRNRDQVHGCMVRREPTDPGCREGQRSRISGHSAAALAYLIACYRMCACLRRSAVVTLSIAATEPWWSVNFDRAARIGWIDQPVRNPGRCGPTRQREPRRPLRKLPGGHDRPHDSLPTVHRRCAAAQKRKSDRI